MEPSENYQTTVDADTFHPRAPDPNDAAKVAAGGEGLPAPDPADANAPIPRLDVSDGAASIALDGMGPVVVNADGTLARVANWARMTEREREVARRRIAKRNNERLERIRAEGATAPGSDAKDEAARDDPAEPRRDERPAT